MKRLFAAFLLVGFLSAMLSTAAHVHVASDETTLQVVCKLCHSGQALLLPTVGSTASEPLEPLTFSLPAPPPVRLETTVRVLDLSPNHSPPTIG